MHSRLAPDDNVAGLSHWLIQMLLESINHAVCDVVGNWKVELVAAAHDAEAAVALPALARDYGKRVVCCEREDDVACDRIAARTRPKETSRGRHSHICICGIAVI